MTPRPNKSNACFVAEDSPYTKEFFQKWLDELKKNIQTKLPSLDVSKVKFFTASCQHVQDTNDTKKEAEKKRDEIKKHKPVDQDALDKAEKAVKEAKNALEEARKDALDQAGPLLDFIERQTTLDKETRRQLLVADVLLQATPKSLAEYCKQATEDQAKALLNLLRDDTEFDLLQEMVLAGGAKKGKYGKALEIYTILEPQFASGEHPILQRLAMATALELADPLKEFHQDKTVVDPVQRYLHYEQAWMFGELDPAFETFSTWELRNVINGVAPDDQLGWGRQMLMNYRPDLMLLNDKWRYCRLVRTDVYYTMHPDWDPNRPLDFKQIFSAGGACGPRAWAGRFMCKAFGIPTWGVREPGHAAMARWTSDEGWVVCLGAELKWAWWDDRCGLDFRLEADARDVCSPDKTKNNSGYGDKVMVLQWIADLQEEPVQEIRRNYLVDPKALWRSLSMMQRERLLAEQKMSNSNLKHSTNTTKKTVVTRQEKLRGGNFAKKDETIATLKNGTIIIPAATVDEPKKPSHKVMFMDSFLGGQQLFLDKDGTVEYLLTSPPGGPYQMTCKVSTVHESDEDKPPLLITIDAAEADEVGDSFSSDNICSIHSIPVPYTEGMWQETNPVKVELPSNVTSCKINLTRETTARGVAMKDIRLVPLTCTSS